MNTDDGEEEKGTTTSIGNPLPPSLPAACLRWRDSTRRALALSYSYSYFKTRIHGPLYR